MSNDMKHIGNGVYARISDKGPAHVAIWWTGDPSDTDIGHDCDQMGCGSVGPHILAQRTVGASEPDDLATMRAERDAALDAGEAEKARADALERSVFEALPVTNMAFTGDYGLYIRSYSDHIVTANAEMGEALTLVGRALDEAGAPPGASPAERVRALVLAPEPEDGRWLSIVGEEWDRKVEHHATRQDAERCAREWYENELADTGKGREDRGLVALVMSLVEEEVRTTDEHRYIIDGYDVLRLDGAATVQADHAPALRVAVADLAAALGEDAPDTAELRASDLAEVVAGLAARLAPRRGVSVSPIPEGYRDDLPSAAVFAPGWRWMTGMKLEAGGLDRRVGLIEDGGNALQEYGYRPYLDDPVTLGCILALVRKRLGKTAVVRKVGVQLVDHATVDEWAICDTLVTRDGVSQCGPSFYGFRSEIEALVAGLWVDVGGAS